ncbi:MAG: cyclic nucleotide-binding domain-containing protein [Leptospirales bacterium]|nr:cyclic nucleotide-binding domain-containing protein [Leptospirales bacterium]
MALDPQKALQQAKIPAGTVLFEAGRPPSMLWVVHEGEITLKSASGKRLYNLGANSTPGFAALLTRRPLGATYVTAKDSLISAFPVNPAGNFNTLVLGKLNVGILAVRSLMQEVLVSRKTFGTISEFAADLLKSIDNLCLTYYKLNPGAFEGQAGGQILDPLVPQTKVLIDDFTSNGGEIPETITAGWLDQDHSTLLKKLYEMESEFNEDEFTFLRRILSLPADLQGNIFKTDAALLQILAGKLAEMVISSIEEVKQIHETINEGISTLLSGEYSFVEKIFLVADVAGDAGRPPLMGIIRFLVGLAEKVKTSHQTLFGVPVDASVPALAKLADMLKAQKAEEKPQEVSSAVAAGVDVKALRRDLAGSVGKIMNFVALPADDGKKLIADLKTLKGFTNPLDSGGDPRKVRRAISKVYWGIWEKAFFKLKEQKGNLPLPVDWMLRFGFFDDEMLDDEHIGALTQCRDTTRGKPGYSILNALDWLPVIGDKKEPPSLDEMGMGFFEKLKMEHKDKGWKRETDVPDEFAGYAIRIRYEIQNFLEINVRLTSGSPATSFPILTRYSVNMPLDKAFVTNDRLSECVDRILAIDYSLFHRETLFNDEERGILKEFIQLQVMPWFIIVPSIGTKVMMWQDLASPNKRTSKGRIAVPIFATADLFSLMVDAMAAFRWELTKSIQGPDWNNVAVPSITSDYTDYVQFYKKNREISPEIKERLAAEFKRFRSDRDRFTNDYGNWLKSEAEGNMKMNRVVRAIFYRHVPFAKPVRDKVSTQPAFAELHNRFVNIRTKKLRESEARYKKFDPLPDVLKKNLDFYRV